MRGRFLKVQEEFGTFDVYIWGLWVGGRSRMAEDAQGLAGEDGESDALSKDLQSGISVCGVDDCYALMQATGMVTTIW